MKLSENNLWPPPVSLGYLLWVKPAVLSEIPPSYDHRIMRKPILRSVSVFVFQMMVFTVQKLGSFVKSIAVLDPPTCITEMEFVNLVRAHEMFIEPVLFSNRTFVIHLT